jgi:hypothetical protein
MASVAYSVDIAPVACHIVPTLIEGDKVGRAAVVVQNIPDYMAD